MKNAAYWMSFAAFVSLVSAPAFAAGIKQSEFVRISLDPSFEKSTPVQAGHVVVDELNRKVVLTLETKYHCESAVCATLMPEPVLISEPITSITKDECGRIVTRAGKDGSLSVVDSSHAVCGGTDSQTPTQVTLETQGAGQREPGTQRITTVSVFEGTPLEMVPQILPITDEISDSAHGQ